MKCRMTIIFVALCLVLLSLQLCFAAVTAEEAAKLKTVLTPLGAERAGNAGGTIPAWEGGYTTVPPGYKSGDKRPDPYANEKPLYSITQQNMDQYSEKLTEGTKLLLKKYPSFRLDVYPTHRTAAAPQFVYDNAFKNATRAKTTNNGLCIEGAYGGTPFPIPKDGFEVIWNHLLAFKGESTFVPFRNYLVTADGKPVLVVEAEDFEQFPYYLNDIPMDKWNGEFFLFRQVQKAPPFKAGETILARDPVDMYGKGRQAWQYLTGQRRTRRAPSIAYDTPDFVSSGHNYFDEIFVFNGALDRYDWKLVGKREMLIPYNCNKFYLQKDADILKENHANPDYLRWELHRVWVVDALIVEGKRHVVAKRRMYIDEDSWFAVLYDGWDAKGQLWRTTVSVPLIAMEFPAIVPVSLFIHNLQKGSYCATIVPNEMAVQFQAVPVRPDSFFSPDALAGTGIR
ncbi:MAG: DUF1329 domain-containing protein [Pseudomonadota bacterium]